MTRKARKTAMLGAALLGLLVLAAAPAMAADMAAEKGQEAFEANKCNNCHSIEKLSIERKLKSEKMAGPDLSTIGDEHMAEWIVKFLQREVDLDDNLHKKEYEGTKKDLEAIAGWLASLKSE